MTDESPTIPATSTAARPVFVDTLRDDLLAGVPVHLRRRQRRQLAVVAAAGVFAMAVLAVGLWRDAGPFAPAETTLLADGPDTPIRTAELSDTSSVTWEPLPEAREAFSANQSGDAVSLHAVRSVGDDVVAFGSVGIGESWRLVAWRTGDGRAWEQVYEERDFGQPESWLAEHESSPSSRERELLDRGPVRMTAIAEFEGTLLAVGTRNNPRSGTVLIRSLDGGDTWETTHFRSAERVVGVEATDEGFVMVVEGDEFSLWGEPAPDVIVFMEPDVADEDRRSMQDLLTADPAVESYQLVYKQAAKDEFDDLFADSPELTAKVTAEDVPASFRILFKSREMPVGFVKKMFLQPGVKFVKPNPGDTAEPSIVRVRHSTDGFDWGRPVAIPGTPPSSQALDVAAKGRAIVVVGHDTVGDRQRPAAWTSSDGGQTWSTAEVADAFAPNADAGLTGVTATDRGFIATGYSETVEFSTEAPTGPIESAAIAPMLWSATDGSLWHPIPHPAEGQPVYGGSISSVDSGEPAVIVAPTSPLVNEPAALFLMTGYGGYQSLGSPPRVVGPHRSEVIATPRLGTGHLVFVETTTDYLSPDAVIETSAFFVEAGE